MTPDPSTAADDPATGHPHRRDRPAIGTAAILTATTLAFISALVTVTLLLVNGSLVLIALNTWAKQGPAWMQRPGFLQFILFAAPLLLTIVQWMTWDAIRGIWSRETE
ncbi:hypothetical protein NHH03_13430 [Stieleria sp. TO1_6]|uniref:hypothetical protein n=1 Tax=Stieleria tagensis TaxID=2956795 RepID=UPI00209A97F4|nr:hypothetical protein [Stieleria tagensis]MCO8122743.1 hypothetical protein [Stieleria tagensis]